MNFPTIAIIFLLFFCAAWAGICMSRPRIPQNGNITWSKARDHTSARFSEGIPDCIDYCRETNTTNFTKFRDTTGSSGGGDMHKIKAVLNARETKPLANKDAMNSDGQILGLTIKQKAVAKY
uniref:Uncharacterized protein n=1 Tax=Globodera rostochiensis TaxID=31243 RepID=A0A914HLV1_GLORO